MNRVRAAMALLLVGGLCACGGGGQAPADQFYRLDLALPAAASRPVLTGVVAVERPLADDMAGERNLHYALAAHPLELNRDPYRLWTEPPPVLVAAQLTRHLAAAGIAETVVGGDLRVSWDYLVKSRLRHFEERKGDHPIVLVDMDLGLMAGSGGKILLFKNYHVERPVTGDRIDAVITAYQSALDEIFTAFEGDLAHLAVTR